MNLYSSRAFTWVVTPVCFIWHVLDFKMSPRFHLIHLWQQKSLRDFWLKMLTRNIGTIWILVWAYNMIWNLAYFKGVVGLPSKSPVGAACCWTAHTQLSHFITLAQICWSLCLDHSYPDWRDQDGKYFRTLEELDFGKTPHTNECKLWSVYKTLISSHILLNSWNEILYRRKRRFYELIEAFVSP